jgi:protein TonB
MSRSADLFEYKESFGRPVAESMGLHLLLAVALAGSVWAHNHFHGSEWGQTAPPGAIHATLVSAAPTIPLPQAQKPTDNVLATENPSPAPAIQKQQTLPAPDLKAIPIPVKQPAKPKPVPPKPQQQEQKHPQAEPPKQHRANFGEQQPAALPKSMAPAPAAASSPVAVQGGAAGFRYPWYVDVITRKVRQNWYIQEVDPSTPVGRQVTVTFLVARDGSPSQIRIVSSSGSPSLDTSALRAVQRVETFGPLPAGYAGSSLSVAYTFTYDQNTR